MVALPFQTLTQVPPPAASISPTHSCMEKHAMPQNLHGRFPSLKVRRLSRRLLLQFLGFNPILLCVYPIVAAPVPEMKDPEVIRRSNGYFVHSTVDQFSGESKPITLPLDDNQIIKGLKEVLIGMRVGGKRRALIPPSLGYINENLKPIPEEFGPRRSLFSHTNEPLLFEVQLLKVI